ncbi:MAG: pyridoxal phosphate-dependent aminotransferase family protein [Elusimicrobiales bacterium]|nr:pyridoxal phosphate-dependent aminotransferase family protein [Elusimicrobiales bacterium]
MKDLFKKCYEFTRAKDLMKEGSYPYYKVLETEQAPEIVIEGKKMIMLGSNNYLGLANDPRMKQAAIDAIKKFGTGMAGSRLLNGNSILHEKLEKQLAAFKKREAALVYATGYQMNVGVISSIIGKGDYVVIDKLDHASIIDGCRLALGEVKRYRHNDLAHLEKVLQEIGPDHGKAVVVDGVFSMEGEIAPLPEIVKIAKKYGAKIIVDDAHATGVLGDTGAGTCEYFGLENGEVDLIVGTCSKSFASVGGFVAGDEQIIHYIRHHSRSMIFSAALPPASVASISKAIEIIQTEPQLRKQLWDNAAYLKKAFEDMGLDTGKTQTPIVPVIIGSDEKAFAMWHELFNNGLFTNSVISPAVPPNRALLRIVATATHTREQLDRALNIFEQAAKKILGSGMKA